MNQKSQEQKAFFQQLIKRVMILIGIKLLIITFFFLRFLEKEKLVKTIPQACYLGYCFSLEIADTPEKRELWVMFRESLPADQGMLFVFEKPDFWSFWMRNTLIPLDIIRLNEENTVVDFISVPPCKESQCPSYLPKDQAIQAIELNSGTIKKIWLKIGDQLEIKKAIK